MAETAFREALRQTLREELLADEKVVLMGEDIGAYGGSYAVTKGFLEEFGPERVRDMPISESVIVGCGIGAAMGGLRPVVELMTVNFSLLAFDQIINNAAKLHYMSGGQISVPLVIRMASGAGSQLGSQHSHSLEGWFAHVPGLKVAVPYTPRDARGLLKTALRDPNPVIFIEHTALYSRKGEVPDGDFAIPFGQAEVMREGKEVTLIGYSGSVHQANGAADLLVQDGIEAEVLNLRTLRPLDVDTIVTSVRKTHRAVVVEDDWKFGGFAGEIAAIIMEQAFDDLDAPVARVAGADVPMPYAKELERAALPQPEQIAAAARAIMQEAAVISEVVMPQMGADMTEGTIVRWLKNEGEEVARGEIIAEIETDKANVEIEAFESGVFRRVIAQEGATVEVGEVIAVIASLDEDLSTYEAAAKPAEAKPTPAKSAAATDARAAAPATAAPAGDSHVRASPVARKLAEERGLDLGSIKGTGPDGRIVRRDIEAAMKEPAAGAPRRAEPAAAGAVEVVPMSRIRQTIARRMAQSKREAPHYYITADVDMTEAEHERHQINDAFRRELHISVNDFIVKACAVALERHPMFNAWFVDGQVQKHEAINVCIAIALDEGLIAPAILDCKSKRLPEIAAASKSLVERAKSGVLKPEEYSGGTFTVSNLGAYDVEMLIAIIQPPQGAILGVGSVREMPVVRDEEIAVARMMKVALSADHRVTDGAQGAQFLNEIRRLLENPAALLV